MKLLNLDFLASYGNPEGVLIKLLKTIKVPVNPARVVDELAIHPDYPSMLALSDVLTNFGVNNVAYVETADNLLQLETPFIVNTLINLGAFAVVTRIDANDNFYLTTEARSFVLNKAEFTQSFEGTVLAVEPAAFLVSPEDRLTFADRLKLPFIIGSGLLLLFLGLNRSPYLNDFRWALFFATIFKIVGVFTSIALLVQSINSNNPLIQKICKRGKNKDCNAVLSSKSAKLFDWLSWSEIGFFYFLGSLLFLLFGGKTQSSVKILLILNALCLPYTFYSIYFQALIVKKWCVLCCTIQGTLWLEFISLIALADFAFDFPPNYNWSAFIICMLLPVLTWTILKSMFVDNSKSNVLKKQFNRIKYNHSFFNQQLTAYPKYKLPDSAWTINFGNLDAEHIIVMVTNPFCKPCKLVHKQIESLMTRNHNIQLRMIFRDHDIETELTTINRHMIALKNNFPPEIASSAIKHWFSIEDNNYEAWAIKYPVNISDQERLTLDNHRNWCNLAEVEHTPTLFLNGYRLPELYQIPDLNYLLI